MDLGNEGVREVTGRAEEKIPRRMITCTLIFVSTNGKDCHASLRRFMMTQDTGQR